MTEKKIISVSASTFVKAALLLAVFYFAYLILDILVLLFVALILASLIDPLADWFERKKLPRGLAVLVVYVTVLGLLVSIISLLAPIIAAQASQLTDNFGIYWQKVSSGLNSLQSLTARFGFGENWESNLPFSLKSGLGTAQSVIGSLFDFFGGIFSVLLVLVITFYLVVEEESFKKALSSLAPAQYQPYLGQLWSRIKQKLGSWLRGQLCLDLIVGILSYVGLLILDVQYALLLGLMTGLFETIPYVGPIFSGAIAVLLAFFQSGGWLKPLLVAALFIVIQQIENHLLVPKVMQKVAGLNPLVSIMSLLIGYRLLGLPGAILAMPVATVLTVIWADILSWRLRKDKE